MTFINCADLGMSAEDKKKFGVKNEGEQFQASDGADPRLLKTRLIRKISGADMNIPPNVPLLPQAPRPDSAQSTPSQSISSRESNSGTPAPERLE